MTQLIFGKDEELARWAEATFPELGQIARPLHSIGLAGDDGNMLALALYNNFGQNARNETYDLQVTFVAASTRWATKKSIRAFLHYPFFQIGANRMSALTNKSNKKARKLLEGLGFKLEGTHPYGDEGVRPSLSYGLYRDEAVKRWFPDG